MAWKSKKRVYLHIGMPKTGTTTIQSFLASNAKALRRIGCLYPSTGQLYQAHHHIGALLLDKALEWVDHLIPTKDFSLLDCFERELRKSTCDKVVVSTEILAYIHDTSRAVDFFSRYDVQLLFFVRRQDYHLESLCRHEMKNGTFDGVDTDFYVESRLPEANYIECLDRWTRHLGDEKARVLLVDRRAYDEPLQQRFLSACDIEWSDSYTTNHDRNVGLTQECLHFLLSAPEKNRINAYYSRVIGALEQYSKANPDPPEYRWVLSPAQRRRILEQTHDSNVELARRFMRDEDAEFFLDMDIGSDDEWRRYAGLTVEKAVEIGLSVFGGSSP